MANQADLTKKHYKERYRKYGEDPKSLSWGSKGAAHQRFRQIWSEIDFNNKSVLDVGCGFGEMAKFLSKRYKNVEYTGVDIIEEFIETAKGKYPQYTFEVRDYFDNPLDKKFDVVMASGTLNSDLGSKEKNMQFRRKAIKTMFEHTNKVLTFNMLGSHPAPETKSASNVWYADSLEIIDYCLSLTRRVLVRHHYHPQDFTVFMYPVKVKR